MTKLSVIIPVFRVEKFIRKSAESLLSQSIREGIEFIFVDDASPDRSRAILEDVISCHPERNGQVKIITHSKNSGLPAARNTGLEAAKGEYIYHFDSDDFADATLFECMLSEAEKTDADYLWADWFLSYDHSERTMKQPQTENIPEAILKMLSGDLKYNVWNKMVRRSLYIDNNIYFPTGHSMGEDMTMIMLLAHAGKIHYVNNAWYHYVKTNSNAMTASISAGALDDILFNVNRTTQHLIESTDFVSPQAIAHFKLSSKYPFLFSDRKTDYRIWKSLWPESNEYISAKRGSKRYIIELMAKLNFWPGIWLHFKLYKSIYNLLYR